MIKQLIAIVLVYLCTAVAWGILGGTILQRTYSSDRQLSDEVGQLWGTAQNQGAPSFYYETTRPTKLTSIKDGKTVTEIGTETERHNLLIDSSDVNVAFGLDYRQKGLLWYSTYKVKFAGNYKVTNTAATAQKIICEFPLPAEQAIYDNLKFVINGKELSKVSPTSNNICANLELAPGQVETVAVSYDSQGLDDWHYRFGNNISQVKDFSLKMTTDFDAIDFPSGSISPNDKVKLSRGWDLDWRYKNLLTGYSIGMTMPKKLNPGPWVSKVTFFAPVSLFLFFFLLYMFTTIKGIKVHPVNYFFIGAAFFSFHLLMAYLVDHIPVEQAFLISSLVSIGLVVSYMRLVVSNKFAFVEIGISQLVYLVFFSYTFFWEQYTGLVVTILAIITLFVMMQFTGRIDWEDVFSKRQEKRHA